MVATTTSYRHHPPPRAGSSPAQRALVNEADKAGQTPFTDFGGQAVMIGSPALAQTLEGLTWSQLISALRAHRGAAAQAIIGAADFITAELCTLTRDRPATACPASVKDFQLFFSEIT